MSDLHLEAGQQYTTFRVPRRAPYLILAGDIGRLTDYDPYLQFLRSQCEQFTRVFLVLGNHEFFGVSREEGLRLACSLEQEAELNGKLVVLNRRRIDLVASGGGVTILGCTLHSHVPSDAREMVAKKVKDFQRIKNWTVDEHNMEHARDVEWLRAQIGAVRSEDDGRRRILVVTHHAPETKESCASAHVGNPWCSAFATELLDEGNGLADVQCWVFGHTHYSTEFRKGSVKLVSNQRGYVLAKDAEPRSAVSTGLQSLLKKARPSSVGGKNGFDVQKVIRV